jgi:hypothetical protein
VGTNAPNEVDTQLMAVKVTMPGDMKIFYFRTYGNEQSHFCKSMCVGVIRDCNDLNPCLPE